MTVLKHDDIIKKSHVTLITVLVFFERSYVAPHSCNVSQQALNWFRIYGGGPFSSPGYLISKTRLVRVKKCFFLWLILFTHLSTVLSASSVNCAVNLTNTLWVL